ncbi:MAG: barstar family protein [Aerococcus sp.]|nr:barstar family protein [Aerococcus sp.]
MSEQRDIIVDGKRIATMADFHHVFMRVLDVPSSYGENLDAFYDVLTSISQPTTIRVQHIAQLRAHLGVERVATIQRLFQMAADTNAAVTIVW